MSAEVQVKLEINISFGVCHSHFTLFHFSILVDVDIRFNDFSFFFAPFFFFFFSFQPSSYCRFQRRSYFPNPKPQTGMTLWKR